MSGENLLLLVRLAFSLSLVFGLMWVAAKVVRGRNGSLRKAKVDHLEVVERKQLTKNSSIAIVRVGGETLTVGITDGAVSLLGTVDLSGTAPAAAPDAEERTATAVTPVSAPIELPSAAVDLRAPAAGGRRSVLDSLRDRTVRHIAG